MPFDAKDFAFIGVPVTYSQVLATGPSVKATTLSEFVQQAKAQAR